jgi:hypothetical protein
MPHDAAREFQRLVALIFFGKRQSRGEAQSATRTCNDCDLASEIEIH